jgi:hypothetical protein
MSFADVVIDHFRFFFFAFDVKRYFCQVYHAISRLDHTIVAVKTVQSTTTRGTFTMASVDPGGMEALRNEICILSTTDHPCIIKVLKVIVLVVFRIFTIYCFISVNSCR